MKLANISILGNRVSGPIPKELGNISTLANLTMEYNQLSGPIPPELGNLSSIEKLSLISNNLTGELPPELAKLTTIKDFRISDNQIVGTVPGYISSWTHLEKLVIQGTGMNGPLPPGLGSLANLSDLRISDLNGDNMSFPSLGGAIKLKTLILRNCNISGTLPEDLGALTSLKMLDLSFNKLTGQIPESYAALSTVTSIFLTGNNLSGPVPDWMLSRGNEIDLSYNNFSGNNLDSNCQPRKTNLFASSARGITSGIVSCLRNSFHCPTSVYSLHINCGGGEMRLKNGTLFEGDMNSGGPSTFFRSANGSPWAVSSTGEFLDNNLPSDSYIWSAPGVSGDNAALYMNARMSPLSLTYYAFCLGNGNYTVNLHFAEIMFTDDRTFSSLGRRFFDIYIQGKLVKKGFNIAAEAGGINKPIFRSFTAVVSDNTLDIRFFWAGKGTNAIPLRGVYGPLISAISVEPDFRPPGSNGNRLSAGGVAGIVIAVLFTISTVLVIIWWKGCFRRKDSYENDLKGLDLNTGSFTLRQIKGATNNFDIANKIGEGGFGTVYKVIATRYGTVIAVKQLSAKSNQGNREFLNEIGMISALQHPNLVKLYGCCIEGNQLILIYEYMENNSLARVLFGPEEHQLHLDWPTRHKISIGVARGLAYLHEESRLKIVHRDIKATNVLLDKDLNPKISDFGLAKLDDEENTHISTRIAGTFGYMAPEYAMRGYLTDKADVYSFGVVLLELVSGRSNNSIKPKQDCFYLLDWANLLNEEGNLMELIDLRLGSDYNKEQVMRTLHIALLCTNVVPTERPSMSSVVSMLEGRGGVDMISSASKRSASGKHKKLKSLGLTKEQQQLANPGDSQIEMSMDVPFTGSSTATGDLYPGDLYPLVPNTEFLLDRS
ncbi:OLC1v1023310C1 [Oldenlandia corymbosa var. corymbosa]|nr:OLC1v1023310C1 [Oldenlandia corymbosa var. corymbosa]